MPQLILVALLGWAAGALVNYLAEVLPGYRRPVRPVCLGCQAPLGITTYFLWPRRCPACGKPRSSRTWLVEALGIVCAIWLYLRPPVAMPFWIGLPLLAYFGVVVLIDLDHRLILHPVSLFGIVFGLLAGAYLHGLRATLLGGLFGLGVMLAFFLFGVLFVKIVSRVRGGSVEDALGFGDVSLSTVLGLICGWPLISGALLLALLLGGLGSLVYILIMLLARRYRSFTAIPYGPFLVSGAVIALFFLNGFISWINP